MLRCQEQLEGEDADVAQTNHAREVDDITIDTAQQNSVVWLTQIQNVHNHKAELQDNV